MKDWRVDLVEHLRGQRLLFSKYRQPSPQWNHDHCAACFATFAEFEGPDHQYEGYTVGPEYRHGREYEWVCTRCFADLKDEMGWSGFRVYSADHKSGIAHPWAGVERPRPETGCGAR
jgi:hypothetical protein